MKVREYHELSLPVLGVIAITAFCLLSPDGASAEVPPVVTGPSADSSWIARLVAPATVRSAPGSGRKITRLGARARWNGGPAGLLVLGKARNGAGRSWLPVRLPARPNGSRGWIPADRAVVSKTPWRIRVNLGNRTVTLLKRGRPVSRSRAVIGSAANRTPRGLFAISERVKQPDPGRFLGSWALLLTAYSSTLRRFDGGPGQIAIHGRGGTSFASPLGSASSHGCVRINNRPISRLARVAREGTPVRIRG